MDPPRIPPALAGEQLELLRSGLLTLALRAVSEPAVAEEIAQETLFRALEAARGGRLRDVRDVGRYVRGIARHVIADFHRARSRELPLAARVGAGAPRPDALDALVAESECERVRAALAWLSPVNREVLRLCYYEGLSPVQIAARTKEPPERVRKRKSRALARLRQLLGGGPDRGHRARSSTGDPKPSSVRGASPCPVEVGSR